MTTAVMTQHARQRCAEMKISTKVAKQIVRNPGVIRGDSDGNSLVTSDLHPDYAVIADLTREVPVVISVVFRTYDDYTRDGATFQQAPPLGRARR